MSKQDRRILIIPHIHWDREWYAPFQQSRFQLQKILQRLLGFLMDDPGYPSIELDGQTAIIQDFLEVNPELTPLIHQLVAKQRLLIGPWYIPPDEFLVSGEAIIRNLLIGTKTAAAMGIKRRVAYLGDTAGHIAELPQILSGFGILGFVFWRGVGEFGERIGQIFRWRAADGSSVIAVHLIGGFSNARALGYLPETLINTENHILNLEEATRLARSLMNSQEPYLRCGTYIFAARDPGPHLLKIIEHLQGQFQDIEIKAGTFDDLLFTVESEACMLDEHQGEMNQSKYARVMPGKLSTRIWIKHANQEAQDLLERWVEPFSAIAWSEGFDFPCGFLHLAWSTLIQNHFHDTISGCFADEIDDEVRQRFRYVFQIGEILLQDVFEQLAQEIPTQSLVSRVAPSHLSPSAVPLLVFNPSLFPRSEMVECKIHLPITWREVTGLRLIDSKGKPVEFVMTQGTYSREREDLRLPSRRSVTLLWRADVPSLGYSTYSLLPDDDRCFNQVARTVTNNRYIENQHLRVEIENDATVTIYDKLIGVVYRGLLEFEDKADLGDCYSSRCPDNGKPDTRIHVDRIRRIDDGNLKQSLEVSLAWKLPSRLGRNMKCVLAQKRFPITVEISLPTDAHWVSFAVKIDNKVKDHRLRVLFPTGIKAKTVDVAGHFSVVSRTVSGYEMLPRDWDEQLAATQPQKGFIDVSDGRRGIAILAPGLPEYEAIRCEDGTVTVALTLLRSIGWLSRDRVEGRRAPVGPAIPVPKAQCLGAHEFRFAIFPHRGTWLDSNVIDAVEQYRLPLRVLQHRKAPLLRQFKMSWKAECVMDEFTALHLGRLPLSTSFIDISNTHIKLSTLKIAETGDCIVMRLYNPGKLSASGELVFHHWHLNSVTIAHLDETELAEASLSVFDGHRVALSIPSHKIITIKCRIRTTA